MRVKSLPVKLANRLWLALILLSPLAYFAAITLYHRYSPEDAIKFQLDRTTAIQKGREFAASKGVIVDNWSAYLSAGQARDDNRLQSYLQSKGTAATQAAHQFIYEAGVNVLFLSPEKKQNLEVKFKPDGTVLGYKSRFVTAPNSIETNEAEAHRLAEKVLRARPEAAYIEATDQPSSAEDRSSEATIRNFAWKWKLPATPELEYTTTISVRENQIIGEDIKYRITDETIGKTFGGGPLPMIFLVLSVIILLLIVTVFGIFRFAERVRQKEVSYVRIFIIAFGVAVPFIGFTLQSDVANYQQILLLTSLETLSIFILVGCLPFLALGLFLGVAYSSGEGDLREYYPGKLTSLDALLCARWASRNVAQAFLFGAAISGWLMLLNQSIVALFSQHNQWGWRIASFELNFGIFPWSTGLLSWISIGTIIVIFSLLLPLPLMRRHFKDQRLIVGAVLLLAFLTNAYLNLQQIFPWWVAFVPALGAALILVITFFKFDILTALLASSFFSVVEFTTYLLGQPAPALHNSGLIVLVIIAVLFLVALYFYFRGRTYLEDEVRPQYAGLLAERLSLRAEVNAAREAQIRLMPDRLPQLKQLTIAAACHPAHEVGGDYYDLFQLEDNKLGIFMADGGGRGLAAALMIAYAKGYLMPRLKSDSYGDNSPTEIVRGLQTKLVSTMAEEDVSGFIYGVFDTDDQILRYAGTGNFPRPFVNAKLQCEEQQIKFSLPDERIIKVTEGRCQLRLGETLTLLSDGAQKLLNQPAMRDLFWEKINGSDQTIQLNLSLAQALREGHRRIPEVNDDLTAVVVKLHTGGSE